MAKTKEYFDFHCADTPDSVVEHLRTQIKQLKGREYLLEETENGFDLGIGRGGHQGGYWYCATVVSDGKGSRISGRVVYRSWNGEEIKMTWIDKIESGCLFMMLLPVVLVVWIYRLFRPEITDEDRFVEFMVSQMDCELLE